MNVTELARHLKITPQELRDNLPTLGYDIGQKAIKVNNNIAQKIIKDWPRLRRQMMHMKQEEKAKIKQEQQLQAIKKEVSVPAFITVRDFSQELGLPINTLLAELMKNGIFTSLNEKIDYETAWLVGNELGVEITKKEESHTDKKEALKISEIIDNEEKKDLYDRPPVIVIMGHVDHGKTKLLDAIRKTNVVDGEAGGITQHIGAYQAIKNNKLITFIDTPGHEAFTAMRSRGAKIADIAILVVAADDGVKPQTIEAFRIIEAAKIPYLVAINKIDKPEANIDKTKQELSSQLNITPEDWGGKTVCVPISAKEVRGIDTILDTILFITEIEADNIKANPSAPAVGTVIESHVDKGAGPIATILVQNGTLRVNDQLVYDEHVYGKVRALKNYRGEVVDEAAPSMPVMIIGLKTAPKVGDILSVGEGKRLKHKKIKTVGNQSRSASDEAGGKEIQKINLVIKSDVLGSTEAIEESLEKINTKKVKANIIHKGLGNITEGDIAKAEGSHAIVVGFNVKSSPAIEDMARDRNVEVKNYSIIYDLLEDIKKKMQAIVIPDYKRVDIGRLKVLAIFGSDKISQIVGGKVLEGQLELETKAEIIRGDELISEGTIISLQAGKQDVTIVHKDDECGVSFKGYDKIETGDILVVYKEEKIIEEL